MRRTCGLLIAIVGTIFSVFIFNLLMCIFVPEYHDALSNVVNTEDDGIVTVEILEPSEVPLTDSIPKESLTPSTHQERTRTGAKKVIVKDTTSSKPEIIDKTYHEDCGSDKGYWVITYSDGSIGVEVD